MRWTHWALLLCVSCGDPLHPPQRIEKNRVLGAQVVVPGQEPRATPSPGEPVAVSFWMADPGTPAALTYALAVCQRDDTLTGIPGCSGGVIARSSGNGDPALDFTLPADLPPGDRLLVLGVVCANASGVIGDVITGFPNALGCAGEGAQTSRVMFDVFLSPEHDNNNPTLADETIRLDSADWSATLPTDVTAPCAGTSPTVGADGAVHQIRVGVSADDRESDGTRSELNELASFSTAGELSRAFSFIEADSDATEVTLEWKAPRTAPAGGRNVRFFFVLRDGRGGADYSERTLCAVP